MSSNYWNQQEDAPNPQQHVPSMNGNGNGVPRSGSPAARPLQPSPEALLKPPQQPRRGPAAASERDVLQHLGDQRRDR